MSRFAECCGNHERGRRCGACPLDDALVDTLGGNPELRGEILTRLTALRAALAAATAREEKYRQDVVALCMSLTHEGPDVTSRVTTRAIEARSGTLDALAEHTERVVRWCYLNPPIQPLTGGDCETDDEYLARALAAAKGGQDG